MKNIILDYITKEIANEPMEDLDESEDLLGSGLVDSIGMIKLIAFLEEKFQITIPSEDMIVENFMTVQHISTYISNKTV